MDTLKFMVIDSLELITPSLSPVEHSSRNVLIMTMNARFQLQLNR
jgi:hypothetical protein